MISRQGATNVQELQGLNYDVIMSIKSNNSHFQSNTFRENMSKYVANFTSTAIIGRQVWMGCECESLNGLL